MGGRCAPLLAQKLASEQSPPSTTIALLLDPARWIQTLLQGTLLRVFEHWKNKQVRVYSGIKMILFSFLDSGPTQQHVVIITHKVTVFFYSQVLRLYNLSQ